ncbi:Ig-like domain-containing protein [Myxococcus vastator]|uniref:Ig-like domain-containing protein n=1 Tax=Myxococcus vastator TaxID=2709664 RepID=UPI0013D3106E|nr:Ig-like domain-containing protein [Myxococcus vastator]
MSRLPCALLLAAISLSTACINVPEVEPDPTPDGGAQPTTKFTLNVSPSEDSVLQGGNRDIQVSIVRAPDFTDSVTATLEQPPSGISAQPAMIPAGESTAILTIQVSANAAAGEAALTVRAASGNEFRTASLQLAIAQAGDLIVRWATPAPEESVSYTNGALFLEATIEGGTTEAVEFHRDTQLLARVSAPPYIYTWDTRGMAEGEFQLTARAIRGGTSFTSVARTVAVDRTPPAVASRVPASSNAQVSARTSLEATFTESMRSASISQDNVEVLVHGNSRVEAAISLSADGITLTITPSMPIPAPSTVLVKLGTSEQPILDLAGNVLHSTSEWLFTVPVWLPVGGTLSAFPGATPAENAVLKLDADDRPVVAWSEFDGSSKNIHVARWNGSNWVHLGGGLSGLAGAATHAESPALHIDASGRILVVWDEATGVGIGKNLYARRWNSTSWEDLPAFPITGSVETFIGEPCLTTTNTGTVYVYATHVSGVGRLVAFELQTGATNWTPINVHRPPDYDTTGSATISAQGTNVFVAYDAYHGPDETRVIGALLNHSTALGSSLITLPQSAVATSPGIAVSTGGIPFVTWEEVRQSSEERTIHFSNWTGSAWAEPARISHLSTDNIDASLAIGENDIPMVAWSGVTNSQRSIHVSRRPTSTWEPIGPPLISSSSGDMEAFHPALEIDRENRAWLAWHEAGPSGSDIHVYRHNQ